MEKNETIKLLEVAELIFCAVYDFLFSSDAEPIANITIQSDPLQEIIFLRLATGSTLSIKVFPHRNFAQELVYRIEVNKMLKGDMRGNKIAFLEASALKGRKEEIKSFIHSCLSQIRDEIFIE